MNPFNYKDIDTIITRKIQPIIQNNSKSPVLVDSGIKSILNMTLINCQSYKSKLYNILFNCCMLLFFCVLVGGILMYKYKGKPTKNDLVKKEYEKQQYIKHKIKIYQDFRKQTSQELITGLPNWEPDYGNTEYVN